MHVVLLKPRPHHTLKRGGGQPRTGDVADERECDAPGEGDPQLQPGELRDFEDRYFDEVAGAERKVALLKPGTDVGQEPLVELIDFHLRRRAGWCRNEAG